MTAFNSTHDLLHPDEASKKASRYALGLVFIVLQCVVWISAAVLTQTVYEAEAVPPFLLSYIGMSLLAFGIPIRFLKDWMFQVTLFMEEGGEPAPASNFERNTSIDTVDAQLACATHCSDYVDIATKSEQQLVMDHRRTWNHRRHFFAALLLTPAMFGADYMFNKALISTSVATTTVLVSTQSLFVFLFAVQLKLEQFSMMKLLGVFAGLAGTVLMVGDDIEDDVNTQGVENTVAVLAAQKDMIIGDLCAVMAAILYAAYTIQVRKYCPENEDLYSMALLLGYIGVVCTVLLAPAAIYVVIEGDVNWTLPLFAIICFKGLLDFAITDYFMFRSIVLTNATVATVGLGLTIPMAYLADWATGKLGEITPSGVFGALTVGAGFLIVNMVPDQIPCVGEDGGEESVTNVLV